MHGTNVTISNYVEMQLLLTPTCRTAGNPRVVIFSVDQKQGLSPVISDKLKSFVEIIAYKICDCSLKNLSIFS